jgi:hypothetical protein
MGDWIYVLTAKGRLARGGGAFGVPPQLRHLLVLVDGVRTRDGLLAIVGRSAVNAGGLSLLVSGGYIERLPEDAGAPPPSFESESTPARQPTEMVRVTEPAPQAAPKPVAPPVLPAPEPKRPSARAGRGVGEARPAKSAVGNAHSTARSTLASGPYAVKTRPGSASAAAEAATAVKGAPVQGRSHRASAERRKVGAAKPHRLLAMHGHLATYMVETIGRWLDDEEGDVYLHGIERASSMTELLALIEPLVDAVLKAAGPEAAAELANGAASILEPSTH